MTDSVVDCKTEVKQATKYVKETENVAEKYSALTVSKNSSDVNMNVGEMPSAAFTAVPTLKSVKKVRTVMPAINGCQWPEAAWVGWRNALYRSGALARRGADGVTGVNADGGDAAVAKPNDLTAPSLQKKQISTQSSEVKKSNAMRCGMGPRRKAALL